MLNYQPTYFDESLDPIIRQILPDVIQQSLKKELMSQLQEEAEREFEKQLEKIQMQALQEFELALNDLEEQGNKLLKEQTDQLKKDLEKLRREKKNKEDAHMKQLRDRFISENFQQLILTHSKIQEIQTQLALEILDSSAEKAQAVKQRRMKQIAIKLQNKEQKYRNTRNEAIKNEIYQSRSIHDLKKDIQMMKINIASMKSQYNVKIKKIDGEIKQIKERNAQIKPKQDINLLRKQLQILQSKRDQIHQQIMNNNNSSEGYENANRNNSTFSHLDSSSQYEPQQPPSSNLRSIQTMLRGGNIVVEQDYSQSESSYSQEKQNEQSIVNPPIYHPSAEVSQEQLETYETHAPILKLNVANLLRNSWEDPLQKYLSNNNQNINSKSTTDRYYFNSQIGTLRNSYQNNENDGKVGNRSSFQQIYHQHLEKLNQATKRRKLSTQAKNAIIKNLTNHTLKSRK